MSESRPNRILNFNVSTSLPNRQTIQPSHQQIQQVRPAAYQQPLAPAPVNHPVAATVPPRPIVVQYAVPHYPPGYQVLPQAHPQYPHPVPPPSPPQTRNNTASDSTMERLSQSLVTTLTPILVDYEKSVVAKTKEVEGSIEKFAADVKEARNETNSRLLQLTEMMHKLLQIQQAHIKATNKRTEEIEALIMASFDRNDGMSLASCLENIQNTVGELSERIKGSGAQDFFISSQPAPTANTAETCVLATPLGSIEEHISTLVQRVYEDKATFCDILEPPPEQDPGPVGPTYKDATSDAMNLEPEFSALASLIQPEYKNVGNGRRTASLPPQSGQILTAVFELLSSSESDYPRSSTPSSHGELSKVTTAFENRNDTEILGDVEEVNSSPRLESQQGQFEGDRSLVIDVESTVKPEGPDKMVTDNESHADAQMDDERKSDFPAEVTIGHQPNFTSTSLTSDDESVTVPRQTIYNSSRESSLFTPSQEQRTLPSPATTPSAPASPKLSPPANSTLATAPGMPVWTVLSPNPSSNSEFETTLLPTPDYANSTLNRVPTPSTPESAPLFTANATPRSDNESEIVVSHIVTDQRSSPEIPRVSSPDAPAPEYVEQPQAQTSLDDIPLFFPSKSQSLPPIQVDDAFLESSGPFLESPLSSPKPINLSASKSPSVRPSTPVVDIQPTSPTKAPASATIFNTPSNKLRGGNGGHNSRFAVSTPQKTQTIKRPIVVCTPRLHVSSPKKSVPEPRLSSPIFVPSRSLSPLSVISSTSEPEHEIDPVLDSVKVIRKKQRKKGSSQTEPRMSTSISASVRRIDLSQKILAKKGVSTALTRVKKRKAPTAEQMEPPLKRARQKAVAAEAEREVRVKRERLSPGLPSVSAGRSSSARGKGKAKERADDSGYKLPSIKMKVLPEKGEKKLRPRALPPGVKWPQKNTSGNKKLDQQFIECDKCYMWYHYGCIGIVDSNDAIAKREEMFICPPCTGGGANPMLPSDSIVCARPDCGREGKKDDEYFMTAILGRCTKVSSGVGRTYMWLVKWDGYSIRECTWEEEDGMSDPQSFIQDFYRKATRQGKDPDEDRSSTILLREAISGGWTDPNA